MGARGGGSIVNVATMVAHFGLPGASAYGASKAALVSLTQTWAAEYGPQGVRVNAVSAGTTRTEGTAGMGDDLDALAQTSPLGRPASPDEIAEAIVFLASPRSSYINGAILPADGGRTAVDATTSRRAARFAMIVRPMAAWGAVLVPMLVACGHVVRGLVRAEGRVGAVEAQGATPLVADLRGDVEWAVDGCDAAIFAAGARRRGDFGAIEGGGAAKLAKAADRFELRRFVLCSAIGADEPERRRAPLRDFVAAKRFAERRLRRLGLPWTIVDFGGLTDAPGTGHIATSADGRNPPTISRYDAAATLIGALERPYLARRLVEVVEGDRRIAEALDAVEPAPLPPVHNSGLGAYQSTNPPTDPAMLFPDGRHWTPAVDYEGDGPLAPEVIDNDDPSPRIP